MPLMTLMTAALLGYGPHTVTNVRPIADVVEIRPQMLDTRGHRRDAVRDAQDAGTAIVGEQGEHGIAWAPTARNQRERLGGQDAPALIYVRVFDGVFAIDPFEPLPTNSELDQVYAPINEVTARMLFNGSSLETDRALFDRRRIERTAELFKHLEKARRAWLRSNGFSGAFTYTAPAAEGDASVTAPEPAGWFRKPAEMPRGKSREAVQAEPGSMSPEAARAVASGLLDGATRVSVPHTMSKDAADRLAESQQERQDDESEKQAELASKE